MRYTLDPKCDFAEIPAFFDTCKKVLEPYAKQGKWDDVAGLVYYSGWLHGVGDLFAELCTTPFDDVIQNERLMRNLICIQRGVNTVIKAMGELVCYDDAAKFFFRIAPQMFPTCFAGGGNIGEIFREWRSIIDTMNVWIAWHGAPGNFIRANVDSRSQRHLIGLEKKFGKSLGCSMAGLAALSYGILLDRVFWPAYHKIEDKQHEAGIVYCDEGFGRRVVV